MHALIHDFGSYTLHKVPKEELGAICKFVVDANYMVHQKGICGTDKEATKLHHEERSLFSDIHTYVVCNSSGKIAGSIRAGLWNKPGELPLQEEFSVNIERFISRMKDPVRQIWHIGRFAINPHCIDRQMVPHRMTIFKLLLVCALRHVCTDRQNVGLAECDRKLHETVKFLDIHSSEIGIPKVYIGSETVPVFNTAKGLMPFLCRHQHLLSLVETGCTSHLKNKAGSVMCESSLQEQDWVA